MSRRVPYIIEKDSKGEKVYDLYSRLLKDRIVFVIGEIDSELADDVVAQLLLLESTGPEEPVYMYINSPGGELDAMFAMFDTMNYVSCPVYTIGYGRVMSAATFLISAGEPGHRYALPSTNFMIHQLRGGKEGTYLDMKVHQAYLDKIHSRLIDHYVLFTGQNRKKIEQDIALDYFMSAEEAQKYGKKGLIDHIQVKSLRSKLETNKYL